MAFNEDNNKVVKATSTNTSLLSDVRLIVEQGLKTAYEGVNQVQISTYWQIGRRIVEEEQNGEDRAEYGTYLMKNLANEMTSEYGDAYSLRNLQLMRQFYLLFKDLEIVNARVHNLRWTHFRSLLRVNDENARYWYMKEANDQMWSTRTLDRNIASQYYYRLYLDFWMIQLSQVEERLAHLLESQVTFTKQSPEHVTMSRGLLCSICI